MQQLLEKHRELHFQKLKHIFIFLDFNSAEKAVSTCSMAALFF
jgi:hypothetical protein